VEISPRRPGVKSGPASFGSRDFLLLWGRPSDRGSPGVDKGGNVFNLSLLGQYPAANFSAGMDDHGGTLITDPAVQWFGRCWSSSLTPSGLHRRVRSGSLGRDLRGPRRRPGSTSLASIQAIRVAALVVGASP